MKYRVYFSWVPGLKGIVKPKLRLYGPSFSKMVYLQAVDAHSEGRYAPIVFVSVNGVAVPMEYKNSSSFIHNDESIDCFADMIVRGDCKIEEFELIEI